MQKSQSERLPALDSLRGIAAFIVVCSHCYLIYPEAMRTQTPLWVSFSPVRLLLSSYASVILFYVLSGYVLSLPFLRNNAPSYNAYLVKRICRIYLPFVVAILLAAPLFYFSPQLADGTASVWFNNLCNRGPVTLSLVLRHLAMTGDDNDMWLDGVMWSLVYELRISIIFPLLVALGGRPRAALFWSVAFYVLAVAASFVTGNSFALQSAKDSPGSFLLMLRFIPFFIIGTTLARYNEPIKAWLNKLPKGVWFSMFLIAVAAFTLPPEIHNERIKTYLPMFGNFELLKYNIEFILGIASAFLIVSARNLSVFSSFLTFAPVHWLGKVSYSLYLIHLPILFFLFRWLLGKVDFVYIALLAIGASLASAELFYQFVERPSMSLGRRLAKNIEKAPMESPQQS